MSARMRRAMKRYSSLVNQRRDTEEALRQEVARLEALPERTDEEQEALDRLRSGLEAYDTVTDRRSLTSRKNLEAHIPEPIDPEGIIYVGARLPRSLAARLDEYVEETGTSRAAVIRDALTEYLG